MFLFLPSKCKQSLFFFCPIETCYLNAKLKVRVKNRQIMFLKIKSNGRDWDALYSTVKFKMYWFKLSLVHWYLLYLGETLMMKSQEYEDVSNDEVLNFKGHNHPTEDLVTIVHMIYMYMVMRIVWRDVTINHDGCKAVLKIANNYCSEFVSFRMWNWRGKLTACLYTQGKVLCLYREFNKSVIKCYRLWCGTPMTSIFWHVPLSEHSKKWPCHPCHQRLQSWSIEDEK